MVSKNLLSIASLVSLTSFVSACNNTNFTGSVPARATPKVELSCTTEPTAIKVGDKIGIGVTATGDYRGKVFETIITEGESTPRTLSWAENKGFVIESGDDNNFSPNKAGDYRVELRMTEDQATPDFICNFKAEGVSTKPQVKVSCETNTPSIFVGKEAAILAKVEGSYSGKLIQKISGPKNSETALASSEKGWNKEGSDNNNISFDQAGDYTITYALENQDAYQADIGSCGVKVEAPVCEKQVSVGVKIAFLIDNSNSNAATDCASPKKIGTYKGTSLVECQGATNREKAVLSAFDLLDAIRANEPSNQLAVSEMAIASFPSQKDFSDEHVTQLAGWPTVNKEGRANVEKAMQFSRKPFGLTPYGAAMNAAMEFYKDVQGDKQKVAVLVTDGEPTDRDPAKASETAQALKAMGVDVITVFVTDGKAREERETKHLDMLRRFDEQSQKEGKGHWWTNANLTSFQDYSKFLLGDANNLSLVERISSQVEDTCKDQDGAKCARHIVEVQNSAALSDVFKHIITSKAIKCE